MTKKTIAVFGAGKGQGLSVAKRFGREGYQAALVGRSQERLDELAALLESFGVEAATFPADLQKPDDATGLVSAIEGRCGPIEVLYYGPLPADRQRFFPATELDAATEQWLLDLYFLTPLNLIHAVLPGMVKRGNGGVLVPHGTSVVHPMPFHSGIGPAMAAMRHYIHALHGEVADKGVYAGALTIQALIGTGALKEAIEAETDKSLPGRKRVEIDPDILGDLWWDLYTKRDRVEAAYPETSQTLADLRSSTAKAAKH